MLFRALTERTAKCFAVILLGASLTLPACRAETSRGPSEGERHADISRILVIGDSISLGQGAGGEGPDCPLSFDTNRADLSYGAILAKNTGAELTLLGQGGRGLVHNYGDMPVETIRDWLQPPDYLRLPGPETAPDLILVHVGTNDFYQNDAGGAFQEAYTDLFRHLLASYPKARAMALIGPMLDDSDRARASARIEAALAALPAEDRPRVEFIAINPADYSGMGIGCQWHPSARMQEAMADLIMAHFMQREGDESATNVSHKANQ